MSILVDHMQNARNLAEVVCGAESCSETLVEFRGNVANFDMNRLNALGVQRFESILTPCRETVADCLTFTLSVENEPLPFNWNDHPERVWTSLSTTIADVGKVSVEIRLNKAVLITRSLQPTMAGKIAAFTRSKSLCSCIRDMLANPSQLERALDRTPAVEDPGIPRTLLAADLTGRSNGFFCRVLGGDGDLNVPTDFVDQLPTLFSYDKVRDRVHWETPWVQVLTPRHLRIAITDRAAQHADVLKVIDAHAVNLAILYLAGRSWTSNGRIVARFASDRHRFEVELLHPGSELTQLDPALVLQLLDLVDFAYLSDRFEDRLVFAQAAVGFVIAGDADKRISAIEFLVRAPRIKEAAEWNWRSFCEERIDKFHEDAKEVESDVKSAVEQLDANTGKLIEEMSKTFLASVGAFVTAYIAAGLKKDASAVAFQIVLCGYFLYLVLVAGWMNLRFIHDRYKAVQKEFGVSRNRHEQLLGSTRVDELITDQVEDCKSRFWRWFRVSIGMYAFFAALILVLIKYSPRFLF